jgi:hypothetical protein
MKYLVALFVVAATVVSLAHAADLPKWANGTWTDNRQVTCQDVNRNEPKDGGFVYIKGSKMMGHEWSCRATKKIGNNRYNFACGVEDEQFSGVATLSKDGSGLTISWSRHGNEGKKKWQYPSWCRASMPAFWQ